MAQTAPQGDTLRLSVATGGRQAGGATLAPPNLSPEGRFAAFQSRAANLVSGDTNGEEDVFVHSRTDRITTRVSLAFDGAQGNSFSAGPDISSDGRFVVFYSGATNLVPGDTNHEPPNPTLTPQQVGRDAFLRDTRDRTTVRVSVATGGAQADCPSATLPGGRAPCPGGAVAADPPSISNDGTVMAFTVNATTLVPATAGCTPAPTAPATCDTNGASDIFVHDRTGATPSTARVNLCNLPTATPPGPATCLATTLRQSAGGASDQPSISGNGRFLAFRSAATNLVANDTNALQDIFWHDRTASITRRVSVNTAGDQATGGASSNPRISDDGCFVAFRSAATNLVTADANATEDIFVHGPVPGCGTTGTPTTTRVSVPTGGVTGPGTESNASSNFPSISADGRFVAFESDAANLVSNDNNNVTDVFLHDRVTLTTTRVSTGDRGVQATGGGSFFSALSGDASVVAFVSQAANLVEGDTNNSPDAFANNRLAAAAQEPVTNQPTDGGGGSGGGGTGTGTTTTTSQVAAGGQSSGTTSGGQVQSQRGQTIQSLPRTGINPFRLVVVAASLLAVGSLVLTAAQRRRRDGVDVLSS